MVKFQGKGVFSAIAKGKILQYNKEKSSVKRRVIDNTEAEYKRFTKARDEAGIQLEDLYERALQEVGEVNAQIFEIHRMMLEDTDYCDSIKNIIETQKVNAEYAVLATAESFARMFAGMEDTYMQARAADVTDISDRVIACLTGESAGGFHPEEPVILAAEDLSPSETVQFDKSKILAFVLTKGSANSHTAILARTMGIPAVINTGPLGDVDGLEAIVDGGEGIVIIEPDASCSEMYELKIRSRQETARRIQSLKGLPNETSDGRKIDIFANIGGLSDIGYVLANDAGGIGLFRSEFLFLSSEDYPTEEEQFRAYKEVAQQMGGKKVVIRTLDIGADKQIDYFGLPHEENPAMGMRAIRICLTRPELFITQLRALYRASVFGNISIMFPMIISLEEVLKIKDIAAKVRADLRAEGIPFKENTELGIMIETPAAALISDQLAAEVDFFSVGTNDLSQYTLAIDRQNEALAPFFDSHHRAVLKLIQMAAESAHAHGIWIGICGELGADTKLTEAFLDMGIDELSVSPPKVLAVRERVRSL